LLELAKSVSPLLVHVSKDVDKPISSSGSQCIVVLMICECRHPWCGTSRGIERHRVVASGLEVEEAEYLVAYCCAGECERTYVATNKLRKGLMTAFESKFATPRAILTRFSSRRGILLNREMMILHVPVF
jgi:hypothetical protein